MRITNTRLMFIPIAVAALLTLGVTDANAGKASKKTAAAGSSVEVVPAGNGTVILDEYIKTSKYTDLIMSITAECSLVSQATTVGDETASTSAKLRVWVTIDGVPVYVEDNDGSYVTAPEPYEGNEVIDEDDYKVVFCSRVHQQTTENMEEGPFCDISFPFGDFDLCDEAIIETFRETRQANAFTWMALNVGKDPYVHHVQVWADLDTAASSAVDDPMVGGAIGNRTLIIEPVKASKREGISELSAEDGDSDGFWD